MKLRSILTFGPSILLRTSLLIVILLVGCAPASAPDTAQPTQPAAVENEPTAAPLPTATEMQPEAAPTDAPATQASTEVPQVVATSRGPNLEATDPSTYMRASGDLQLVEFFAFW
jgi:hypothetical protein